MSQPVVRKYKHKERLHEGEREMQEKLGALEAQKAVSSPTQSQYEHELTCTSDEQGDKALHAGSAQTIL